MVRVALSREVSGPPIPHMIGYLRAFSTELQTTREAEPQRTRGSETGISRLIVDRGVTTSVVSPGEFLTESAATTSRSTSVSYYVRYAMFASRPLSTSSSESYSGRTLSLSCFARPVTSEQSFWKFLQVSQRCSPFAIPRCSRRSETKFRALLRRASFADLTQVGVCSTFPQE